MDESVLKQARILILSDDKAIVRSLERVLRTAGWGDIKSSYDAREAVGLFAKFQPDLILLGLRMAHGSGLDILERLRESSAGSLQVPVIVVTSERGPERKLAAVAAGASDFLAKPLDEVEVLTRVRNLLEVRIRRLQASRPAEDRGPDPAGPGDGLHTEALERLALAAEFRDDLTGGQHVRRVGQTAALLARAVGLREERVEMIRLAAPLHDLGKLAMPDRILLKPGPLTAEEYDVIKTHTTIGAQFLTGGQHPLLQLAERIALYHHERWDGGGFPEGLRGEAIPVEARIVAVADAFDAMNSDRPYRKALSAEEIWNILVDGAGRQWDLVVVDALASLVRVDVPMDRPFDLRAFLEQEPLALDPRR